MSSSGEIRRTLGWVLVGSLCLAAATAIFGIVTDSFDDTDWRVIGTSAGFAVFSATGASGATLRLRSSENLRTLGLVTMVASGLAFLLLVAGLWNEDSDTTWRWWGAAVFATFASSHASLVAGARRDTDTQAVRAMAVTSIVLSAFESGLGILACAGVFDDWDVDEDLAQFLARVLGVLLVLMLLTTVLPPIVRRLQGPSGATQGAAPAPTAAAPPAAETRAPSAPAPLAAEVIAAADRILELNGDPGNRAPEIRREAERLRELARSYSR